MPIEVAFIVGGMNREVIEKVAKEKADKFFGYRTSVANPEFKKYQEQVAKLAENEGLEGPEPKQYVTNTEPRPYVLTYGTFEPAVDITSSYNDVTYIGTVVATYTGVNEEPF